MTLKKKQLEILDFIKQFIAIKGYSPTIREIGAGVNLKSPSTVQNHLKKLVSLGLITTDPKKSRTIELLVENEYQKIDDEIVSVPLIDGDDKKFIKVPKYMLCGYDIESLVAFIKDKHIYIINKTMQGINKPSLVKNGDKNYIDENPEKDILGNVISEFRQYK